MSGTRHVAVCGLLVAVAFSVSWLESILPLSLPVPGLKLGLANIVTLFALYKLGPKSTLAILTARCALTALLFGGVTQLFFSLSGGIMAYAVMLLLKRFKFFSPYGVSIAGAAAHNIGQTTAAVVLMGTPALYSYLLFLLPTGIFTGLLTAQIFKLCERVKIH